MTPWWPHPRHRKGQRPPPRHCEGQRPSAISPRNAKMATIMSAASPSSLLIVDDDNLSTSLLEFLFQRQQVQVTTLHDGQAALAYIQTQPPVSVVVCEVMLPHVSGFELLEALGKQPGWQHTRCVMLSAKDQLADLKQAFALGAHDYVLKPFDPEELLARVSRFLPRHGTP